MMGLGLLDGRPELIKIYGFVIILWKKTDAAHVAPVHVSWHTKRKTTNVY